MPLTTACYVPSLRWRKGEYDALLHLTPEIKANITPFITIPAIEWDFETNELKKTVDDYVRPFASRFIEKWGGRVAWLALK